MPAISQAFRCFDEVARRGSIRKAAEGLHLTPAAVNQQVLNLEALVGMPLFDRLPRGMQLTTAGEIVVAAVRRSQRDFDNALSQVEDLRALRRGHVNVAVAPSTAEFVMPPLIERLMSSHPGLTYGVRSGNGESLLRWVANGEADLAYCLRRPAPPGVQEVRSWPQHLGVVTRPDHAIARRGEPVPLRDCVGERLVLMSPDLEMRTLLDHINPRVSQQLQRPMVETNSPAMARTLVAATGGVTFLLRESVAAEVEAGRLAWTPLSDPGAVVHTCVYQRVGYVMPLVMGLFLAELERSLAEMARPAQAKPAARARRRKAQAGGTAVEVAAQAASASASR